MKSFLIYTAVIEALAGFGLIITPSKVVSLLLVAMELHGSLESILSMVAGAAIVICILYLNKKNSAH